MRVRGVHRDSQVGGHGRSAHETAARPDSELPNTRFPGKNQPIQVIIEQAATTYVDNSCAAASDSDCVEATRVERAPRDIEVAVAAVLRYPLRVATTRPERTRSASGLIHDRYTASDIRPRKILVVAYAATDVDDGVARSAAECEVRCGRESR